MAFPGGEAGHILRLIRPCTEYLGWAGRGSVRLGQAAFANSEEGYWLGTGGTIQQIIFASEVDATSSWLAVRQIGQTNIFRPVYRSAPVAALVPPGSDARLPPSRIFANPIVKLSIDQTGGFAHEDVTFNPWYTRQFAVVDSQGYWSIWDIEGQKRKHTTFKIEAGKSGRLFDDYTPAPGLPLPDTGDKWGRLLWAGNVNTMVVCGRRYLAVFDLKSKLPRRLHSPDFIHPQRSGWILDIKRNPIKHSHVIILTSSQVFWTEVIAAGENRDEYDGEIGMKLLASCYHLRDETDTTMKLHLSNDNNGIKLLVFREYHWLTHS